MRDKENDGVRAIGWRSNSFSRAESVAFGKQIGVNLNKIYVNIPYFLFR